MTRWNAAFVIVLVGGLAACRSNANPQTDERAAQTAPASTVAAAQGPDVLAAPAAPATAPAFAYEPEPAARAPRTSARPPAITARTARSNRAPVASRPATPRPADDDRVVEPLEPEVADSPRVALADDEPVAPESRVRERLVLPAGTELRLVLEETLSSETSHEGDRVTARVERALTPDGRVALPGGTVLRGTVYRADSAGRVKGRSRLGVDFNRIVVRGVEHAIDTTAVDVQGPDNKGRDAAIVGGGTAGGAILGGILGGGKGARKGAVIGAVGGAGAVLATKGKEVELPSGSRWSVRVKGDVRLE